MPLFSVIIADDDYLVIDDLKKSIPWGELGYAVVGTATNGQDALNLVRRHQPDLLITDIIMPSMTGLELIEEVRKSYPDMQILIISSYDEFEYAKSAIAHGVADYILKTQITPMSFSQRLIELSNATIAKKRRIQAALRQSLQDYFNPHFRDPVSESADPLLYSAVSHRYYFIVIGVHRPFVESKEVFDGIVYANAMEAEQTIISKFTDYSIPIRFISGGFLIFGFVSTQDARQPSAEMQGIVGKLRSILATAIARSVDIFTWATPCTLAEFRDSYFQLLPLMAFHSAFCKNITIPQRELMRQSYVPSQLDFPFGSMNLHSNKLEADLDRLNNYMQKRIACNDIAALHHMYWLMIGWLHANAGEVDPDWSESWYFSNPQRLSAHVNGLIQALNEPAGGADATIPIAVEQAMRHIREHFSEHEINVQSISDAVKVSSGRLGVLFRQSLGKSINEYLTDVRIEHAVYLLEHTTLKIYEVADQSGFNTPHYFSDIIYKKTGKRPIDYKRLSARE